jgi:hypothetical protein
MGADVASIANHHQMNLLLLSEYSEIWDLICWQSSGNSVSCLCMSSRLLRASTRRTPAFVFLAGRDTDGNVVAWNDRSNIFTPSAVFRNWIPDVHYRLRAESFAYVNDRHCAVFDAVIHCMNHMRDDMVDFEAPPCYAECFGCPSSPISQSCVRAHAHRYAADESLTTFTPRCHSPLIPALFPAADHARVERYFSMNNFSSDYSDDSCSDDSCSSDSHDSSDGR